MEILELFKSKCAKSIFEVLLEFPKREFTIRELAREANAPFSSTRRLIEMWERVGIIETSKLGRNKVIRFHKSKFTNLISKILKMSISPQKFTVKELKVILKKDSKIKNAYLFGSTAKGKETLVSDIDLAILASVDYNPDNLMSDIAKKYGTKIVPILFNNEKELNKFLENKEKVKLK